MPPSQTRIKKSQIATEEFILNPQPSDPWSSTTETASQAAIAAKIAAGEGRLYHGYCTESWVLPQGEGLVSLEEADDFSENVPSWCVLVLEFSYDVPDNGLVYFYRQSDGNYLQYSLTYRGQPVLSGHITNGDKCTMLMYVGEIHLLDNDRWGDDISAKQDLLVGSGVGQNIRKVLSNSLPGGGNIDIVGVCNSAEYADALVAAVDGFVIRDNAIAHIRFVHGIKTTVNSVYPKTLDINGTGPKSLMVWGSPNDFSYAGSWLVGDYIVASVVYLEGNQNYSEGYYIFGTSLDLNRMRWLYNNKQGNLPTFVGNAGKVLGVNDNADGLVWKTLGYETAYTVVSTTPQDDLTLYFVGKTHHHVKMEAGVRAVTIVADIRNDNDNILTVDFKGPRADDLPTILNLSVKKNGSYVTRLITGESGYGGHIEHTHDITSTKVVVDYNLHATNNYYVNHAYFVIKAATLGSVTYGIVNAMAMLCSDILT